MLNVFSSPGDPIFYLHHTYLDKLWWDWQAQNLSARLVDITGRNTPAMPIGFPPGFNGTFPPIGNGTIPPIGDGTNATFPGGPSFPINGSCAGFGFPGDPGGFPGGPGGNVANLMKRDGDLGDVTTLTHVLMVYGAVPNATIADVMDIQGGLLCYEYV